MHSEFQAFITNSLTQLVHGFGHLPEVCLACTPGTALARVDLKVIATEAFDPMNQLEMISNDLFGLAGFFELHGHRPAVRNSFKT